MKFLIFFSLSALLLVQCLNGADGKEFDNSKTKGTNKLTGFFNVGDFTYFAGPRSSTHTRQEATDLCAGIKEGMKLASFETEEKWMAFKNFIIENNHDGISFMTSGIHILGSNVWIWETLNQEFTYTDWGDLQPNDTFPENCCYASTDNGWSDHNCQSNTILFCEGPLQK